MSMSMDVKTENPYHTVNFIARQGWFHYNFKKAGSRQSSVGCIAVGSNQKMWMNTVLCRYSAKVHGISMKNGYVFASFATLR